MLHVLKVHIITYVYYKCFYECHYVFLLHITFYTTYVSETYTCWSFVV